MLFRRCLFISLLSLLSLPLATTIHAEDYTDPASGIEFVFIESGTMIMGDIYAHGLKYERPAHKVNVASFYMGKHEVTFAQYDMFCEATKRSKADDEGWGRGSRPAINISWDDAVAFTRWLSKKSKRTFRLPTEAEWEYAARGGKGTDFWWGMQAGRNNANCKGCGTKWDGEMTAPVGSFAANPYGLFDMNGNVYEWCLDHYHTDYKNAPDDGSAWTVNKTDERMQRSGSFYREAFEMRNSTRAWDRKDSKLFEYGFRLVLEPQN